MQNLTLANSWRRAEEILNLSSWFAAWTLLRIVTFVKFSSLWHTRVIIWIFIEIWANSKHLTIIFMIQWCLWSLKGLHRIPFIDWSPSKWYIIKVTAIHLPLNSLKIAVAEWSCSWIQIDPFQLMQSIIILVFELRYNRNWASLGNAIQRQSDLFHRDFGFKFGILPRLADKSRNFVFYNLLWRDLSDSFELCGLPTDAQGLLWSFHTGSVIGLLLAHLLKSMQINIIWLLSVLLSVNVSSFKSFVLQLT